jgi:hypothetical protein
MAVFVEGQLYLGLGVDVCVAEVACREYSFRIFFVQLVLCISHFVIRHRLTR